MQLSRGYKNIISDYKAFCENGRYIESEDSYSLFCQLYLMKDTSLSQKRINALLGYIENR